MFLLWDAAVAQDLGWRLDLPGGGLGKRKVGSGRQKEKRAVTGLSSRL